MSDLDAYLDKEEAELGIVGQALNMEADADMMSADLENTAEALDPEPPAEVVLEWANLPVDGSDCIPLTTDQLTMVAESVWQRIGHRLDAKRSQDSNEHDNVLNELTELQGKFSELSEKYKAAEAKIASLKKERDVLWGEISSFKLRPGGTLSTRTQSPLTVVQGIQVSSTQPAGSSKPAVVRPPMQSMDWMTDEGPIQEVNIRAPLHELREIRPPGYSFYTYFDEHRAEVNGVPFGPPQW